MKKLSLIGLFAAAFSLSACLSPKITTRAPRLLDVESSAAQDCKAMRTIGNYTALKADYERHLRTITSLSQQYPLPNQARFASLLDQLKTDTQKLKALASADWNNAAGPARFEWSMRPEDFGDPHFSDVKIQSIKVLDGRVYGRALDATSTVTITHESDSAKIELSISSSPFEICELSAATALHLAIQYTNYGFAQEDDVVLYVTPVGGRN